MWDMVTVVLVILAVVTIVAIYGGAVPTRLEERRERKGGRRRGPKRDSDSRHR